VWHTGHVSLELMSQLYPESLLATAPAAARSIIPRLYRLK
jgi:hypothetical protein